MSFIVFGNCWIVISFLKLYHHRCFTSLAPRILQSRFRVQILTTSIGLVHRSSHFDMVYGQWFNESIFSSSTNTVWMFCNKKWDRLPMCDKTLCAFTWDMCSGYSTMGFHRFYEILFVHIEKRGISMLQMSYGSSSNIYV